MKLNLNLNNSTNNSSSNINKISVFGKEKYCFHARTQKIVKAVTLSTGSSQKEILMAQRNQHLSFKAFKCVEFVTDVAVLTIETI